MKGTSQGVLESPMRHPQQQAFRGVRKTRRKPLRLTEGDSPRPRAGTRYGLVVRHPISQAIPQSQWGCACLQGPLSPPKR